MIKKTQKINNVGSFFSFDWDKFNPIEKLDRNGNPELDNLGATKRFDSTFGKVNLLHGDNGNGKSTLVKIFKALNLNQEQTINKHWDNEMGDRTISIITDSSAINFDETSKWLNNHLENKIIILDKEFVSEYIHSGHLGRTSQHDKNTGQLVLYLGDFASYKNQLDKIISLRNNIQNKSGEVINTYQRKKEQVTKAISNADIAIEYAKNFCDKPSENIKSELEKIESENKKLTEDLEILLQGNDLLALSKFKEIKEIETTSPEARKDLLPFTIHPSILKIKEKIQEKESFIAHGIKIINEKELHNCPLCEQSIFDKDQYIRVIKDYLEVFNVEFLKIQDEIKNGLQLYLSSLQYILSNPIPQQNSNILTKYNQLFKQKIELSFFSLSENEKNIIKEEIKRVQLKISDLLKPLFILDKDGEELTELYDKVKDSIKTYNKQVNELNEKIKFFQEKLKSGKVDEDINDIKIKIEKTEQYIFVLENINLFSEILSYEININLNNQTISLLDLLINELRNKINGEFAVFITDYLSSIKNHIKNLYPKLEIVEIEKSRGTTYDFRNNKINCGFFVKYNGRDRFKDLSEGEKQVIALAYFFAMLDIEQDKEEKIVVFDDPITSFDAGKRRQTAELIFKETEKFKQIFILTCDPLFKQYCQKGIPNQKSYYILKSATSSIIYTPKDAESIFNSFKKDLSGIDSSAGTDENIVEYGQKLRFCIEEIRETYLGHNTDGLQETLKKVKGIDFDILKIKIDEILSIYSYCNVGGLAHFPKDGSTTWDELKNQVNKYLSLSL